VNRYLAAQHFRRDSRLDARDRILQAAKDVFVAKGIAGARMQEIADRASVNKAMIHYYFTSKNALYETVILTAMQGFLESVRPVLVDGDRTTEERIRQFVAGYFDFLRRHPDIPRLLMQVMLTPGSDLPSMIAKAQGNADFMGGQPIVDMIEGGSSTGEIRPVDPTQTAVSIISMSVFSFIAGPVLRAVFFPHDGAEDKFMEEREASVVDLLLNGLLPRGPEEARS
jgi:TetR/AcrR family transcriptional regulator